MTDTDKAIAQALVDLGDAYLYKPETVQRMARFFARELASFSPKAIQLATAEAIRIYTEFPRVPQLRELALKHETAIVAAALPAVEREPEKCSMCGSSESFWRDPDEGDPPEMVAYWQRFVGKSQLYEFKHFSHCPKRRCADWPLPENDRGSLRIVS